MAEQGWNFAAGEGVVADPEGAAAMHEIYRRADPHFTGRVTVPVLWDKQTRTIVNNESAEIIRIFNAVGEGPDFCPEALLPEIDAINARVFETVNNGVYRAGFATSQAAYDAAVAALFDSLDWLEARLAKQPYLCGDTLTEADWRLFPTLIRFDAVYVTHFKCNNRRIANYPALQAYTKRLYRMPGIAQTCDFGHIKRHYFQSHRHLNPSGIVPAGPELDF
jgi:putative glutathione S-transferase